MTYRAIALALGALAFRTAATGAGTWKESWSAKAIELAHHAATASPQAASRGREGERWWWELNTPLSIVIPRSAAVSMKHDLDE